MQESLIKDDFPYGSVFRTTSQPLAVQYSNVGEACAIVVEEGKYLIGNEITGRTLVVASKRDEPFKSALSIVRANDVARFVEFQKVNELLTAAGLDTLVKMANCYLSEDDNARLKLDDAIMTMVLAGKKFGALLWTPMATIAPTVWDNQGVSICGSWWGFPSNERAVATLLELPSDTVLVRL